jgi:hypothetical protein
MTNASRIEAVRRDVVLAGQRWLAPETNRAQFVAAARQILAEVEAKNYALLGQVLTHHTVVDGVATEAIDGARSRIVRSYDLLPMVLSAIGRMLWRHSPYRRGRYRASHRLLADGAQIGSVSGADWQAPQVAETVRELMFVPTAVYAKPIERGRSRQAPGGVYQVVAPMANHSFGRFAKISFGYRSVTVERTSKSGRASASDRNQPAIIIRPR